MVGISEEENQAHVAEVGSLPMPVRRCSGLTAYSCGPRSPIPPQESGKVGKGCAAPSIPLDLTHFPGKNPDT